MGLDRGRARRGGQEGGAAVDIRLHGTEVNIRLHGTEEECAQALARLRTAFAVVSVRGPYPDRGDSVLCRLYADVRLDAAAGGGQGFRCRPAAGEVTALPGRPVQPGIRPGRPLVMGVPSWRRSLALSTPVSP